jgi:hypothetical protein
MPDPDVTARRPAPDPPRDATVKRPVHAAGPPQPPPAAPPATPPATPPPAAPQEPEGDGGAPARGKLPLIIGAVLAVVAIVVIVILVAGSGGGAAKKRAVALEMNVAAATPGDARVAVSKPGSSDVRMTFVGRVSGRPFGNGNVTLTIVRNGLRPGRPLDLTARLLFRFDAGRIDANGRWKSVNAPAGTLAFRGTGRIVKGTGDFKGAVGRVEIDGRRPKADEPIEIVSLKGSVEY